jgi:Ca2+:H+ antiporter
LASHAVKNSWWTIAAPVLAIVAVGAYLAGFLKPDGGLVVAGFVALLCAAVFAAVHHAEVVAAKVGEPYGSIILAVAVTIIEVGLILAIMLGSPDGGLTIARDTVYSAVMIVLSGMIGLCLMLGGGRHFEQVVRVRGTTAALAVLAVLATAALILPNYTEATRGPTYSLLQLGLVAVIALVLYGTFLFAQTVRHRDYFLAIETDEAQTENDLVPVVPSHSVTMASLGLLCVALVAVVVLAKGLSAPLAGAIAWAGFPLSFTGVVIAALVLLPEGIAAVRAALANRLQTSINLALGSALASIGLTIPAVSVVSVVYDQQLQLGVSPAKTALLVLALFISGLTLGTGRTTVLQGAVHFSIFAMFLLLAAVP